MYKVLVTGGTKGIGLAVTTMLRESGYEVIACARDVVSPDIRCDVTDREQVRSLREQTGGVDILINNVGGPLSAPFLKTSEELWDEHFQWNVKSVYYCIQNYLPYMLEKKWGRIVNIASTAGKMGAAYLTAYVSAKHAVVGLTKALAIEVAQQGVTVNAICPSFVDTPMLRSAAAKVAQKTGRSVDDLMTAYRDHNPQKRFVTAEEVANAVKFVIETQSVNGQALALCGGETY